MKHHIGIDPGKSGGLVHLTHDGLVHHVAKMPDTEYELVELLELWVPCSKSGGNCFAHAEYVRSSPQMGVTSAFTFGQNYGTIRGVLAAMKIPLHEVKPQDWQREFSLPTRRQCGYAPTKDQRELAAKKTPEGKAMKKRLARELGAATTAKKNAHKARAQERWPAAKRITHAIADALLIAEYGRRQR